MNPEKSPLLLASAKDLLSFSLENPCETKILAKPRAAVPEDAWSQVTQDALD